MKSDYCFKFLLCVATGITVANGHPLSTISRRAAGEPIAREILTREPLELARAEDGSIEDRDLKSAGDTMQTVSGIIDKITPVDGSIEDRDLKSAGDTMQTVSGIIDKITPIADALGPEGEVLGEALDVVASFLDIFGQIFSAIGEEQREDAAARGAFTQNVTDGTLKRHPGWNVVTVHPKHTVNFQGKEGPDWSHNTTSLQTHAGNINFDIYAARAGEFQLNGDGGYMNWAYSGPNIERIGDQGHHLIFHGAAPSNKTKYATGNCGIHVTQYQMNEKKVNPVGHYTLDVVIKDAKGTVVGFDGKGDGSKPVDIKSQLPNVLTVTAGKVDSDPLGFAYGKDKWDSNTKGRCSVGKYDSGSRQMDCGFSC